MAAEVQNSDLDSQFKTTAPLATKMKNQRNQGGDELLKAVLRKRTKKTCTMESTAASTESKKICIYAQNLQSQIGEKLFKAPTKMTGEKVNMNESESKNRPREESKKMCACSPTTHEGSFRCHLHRIGAAKNSVGEKKSSSLSCSAVRTSRTVEFKPQLSRFGRAASAELVINHDGLSQPSIVGSS